MVAPKNAKSILLKKFFFFFNSKEHRYFNAWGFVEERKNPEYIIKKKLLTF